MKHTLVVTPSGEELVLIAKADFDRIEEILDVAAYDAAKAADRGETLGAEDALMALEAPTPLAFWRERRGLSAEALARRIGVAESRLDDLEAGRAEADPALLKRLAAALGVSMEELIDDR